MRRLGHSLSQHGLIAEDYLRHHVGRGSNKGVFIISTAPVVWQNQYTKKSDPEDAVEHDPGSRNYEQLDDAVAIREPG
jgi:hypothetical protein